MNISVQSPLQSAFSGVPSYVRQDTQASGTVLRSGVLAPVDQAAESASSQNAAARSPVSTDTATSANGAKDKAGKSSDKAANSSNGDTSGKSVTGQQLTPQQKEVVQKLQARDQEVRQHEAAHQAAGGSLAGAASFTYERGPNGVEYAIGGDVPIEIIQNPGNPQATIQHMEQVRAAALAPANPSAQDRSVAAEASQILLKAQAQLVKKANQQLGAQTSGSSEGGHGQGANSAVGGQSSSTSKSSLAGIQTYQSVAGGNPLGGSSSTSNGFSASA